MLVTIALFLHPFKSLAGFHLPLGHPRKSLAGIHPKKAKMDAR